MNATQINSGPSSAETIIC